MIPWGEFRERVRRLKAERWADMLASEPPGRPAGRHPRDPEQEALLAQLDRARIARSDVLSTARRVPPEPGEGSQPPAG
jgi:hypothetical protein